MFRSCQASADACRDQSLPTPHNQCSMLIRPNKVERPVEDCLTSAQLIWLCACVRRRLHCGAGVTCLHFAFDLDSGLNGVRSSRYKVVSIQVDSIQTEVVSRHHKVDSIHVESRFDPTQPLCSQLFSGPTGAKIDLFRLSIQFSQYRSCDDTQESIFFESCTFSCLFSQNSTKVQTSQGIVT